VKPSTQLPGNQWLLWLRSSTVRAGVLVGIYVSFIFVAWLLIANWIPQLAPFAAIRNYFAGTVLLLTLGIPIVKYASQPGRLFLSGATAWTILTLTYMTMELHFTLLSSRMGAFNLFVLGIISYGLISVFEWVFLMCAHVRHRHVRDRAPAAVPASRRDAQ
jgi:hypothetical protein